MNIKIGTRIMLNMGAVAALTGIALGLSSVLSIDELIDFTLEDDLQLRHAAFELAINSDSQKAVGMAAALALQPNIGEALAKQERQDLANYFVPGFQTLKEEYGVRQFQFHLPSATSFFRVHNPEKFGDDLSSFRKTVLLANQEKQAKFGIEKGVAGLGIRGVVPVFHDNRHVGSVEFGTTLGVEFLESFSSINKSDLILYIEKNGELVRSAETSQQSLFTDGQLKNIFRKDEALLITERNDFGLAAIGHPVKDFSGEIIGVIEINIDATTFFGRYKAAVIEKAIVTCVIVVIATLLGWFLSQNFSRPICKMTQALTLYANRDFSIAIKGRDRGDELGEMARAVEDIKKRGIEIQQAEERQTDLLERIEKERFCLAEEAHYNLKHIVQAAVEANEAMAVIAHMTRDVRSANEQSQLMASAIEEMVASVQDIALSSDTAAQEANSAEKAAEDGVSVASEATLSMSEIFEAVQDSAGKVDRLSVASNQIGQIVEQIEMIAEQTNLLALNATIEAARAGEAGKGFAVVAAEVKTLANQTGRATEDIRQRIETLRAEMDAIVLSMRKGAEAVQGGREVIAVMADNLGRISKQVHTVTERMSDISAILSQQTAASTLVSEGTEKIASLSQQNAQEINDVLTAMDRANKVLDDRVNGFAKEDDSWITLEIAKNDHISFKSKIIGTIIGHKHLKSSSLYDHHLCHLGRWYDSVQDEGMKNCPEFQQLFEPHKAVHAYGQQALVAYEQGDMSEALSHVARMNETSKQVLALLDVLAQKAEQKQSSLQTSLSA